MKNKYILLLLFAVVVLFSLLGSFSEGFDDMPVPLCKDKECSGDDYILKSQVVPPVCPACPGFLGTDDSDEKGSPIDDTSTKDNIVSEKVIEKGSPIDDTSTKDNIVSEKVIEKEKEKTNKNKESKFNFKQTIEETKNSIPNMFEKENDGGKGIFESRMNQKDINEYDSEISKLKERLKELKGNNGNCPPCPACERCPEPSFDCKKVPNYRSTSVGNYLPMPVLNDFSGFS
jgi:peptidoglycan hydrolase CwlO-like protein